MQEWTEGKTENKSLENYLLNVPFSGVRQVALWIMVSTRVAASSGNAWVLLKCQM